MGTKIFVGALARILVGGTLWLLSKSAKTDNKEKSTIATTTSNSGLSGLLGGLNLSGLKLSLA